MEGAMAIEDAAEQAIDLARDPLIELPPQVGQERRLHARAYAVWAGLRRGGGMPSLTDFHAADRGAFATHGLLLSPTTGKASLLGDAIATEAALAEGAPLGGIAADTMLAALVQRLGAIVAQRAPIGFEAEYPGGAGRSLYRGILLPLTGPSGAIDHIYAVIGWRRLAMSAGVDVTHALHHAFENASAEVASSPWAAAPRIVQPAPPLADRLAAARALAHHETCDREQTLIAALSATHDLLIAAYVEPQTWADLASETHGGAIARAVRMVFGGKAGAHHCRVLVRARRLGIGEGMLAPAIQRHRAGLAGFAASAPKATAEDQPTRQLRLIPLDPALLAPRIQAPIAQPAMEQLQRRVFG